MGAGHTITHGTVPNEVHIDVVFVGWPVAVEVI